MARQGPYDSFVARIWLERGSNGKPLWRGHVRHVQGGQETYFQSLGGMSAFLGKITGVPGPEFTGPQAKSARPAPPPPEN